MKASALSFEEWQVEGKALGHVGHVLAFLPKPYLDGLQVAESSCQKEHYDPPPAHIDFFPCIVYRLWMN